MWTIVTKTGCITTSSLAVRVYEGVEEVIALLQVRSTAVHVGSDASMHCFALHEALGVDDNLLRSQLLRNLMQSLSDLSKVAHRLQLLTLYLICGLFDYIDARLHASELLSLFDLRKELVKVSHEG